MDKYYYTASAIAFTSFFVEWQKARNQDNASVKENWPMLAFLLALAVSLPSAFLALHSEQDGFDLISNILFIWSTTSLTITFMTYALSVSSEKNILFLTFLGIFVCGAMFFMIAASYVSDHLKDLQLKEVQIDLNNVETNLENSPSLSDH